MRELNEERWLDLQTRAVFVELCLYNPNTNLFTFLRMGAEFPETGGNNVWRDLKTLRLYQHLGALGAYVFVCELLAMLFVLILTVKAMLKVKAQKCAYFTDFWQVSEPGNSRAGVDFLKHVFINQHTKELISARNT